jgi:hypothetical protein
MRGAGYLTQMLIVGSITGSGHARGGSDFPFRESLCRSLIAVAEKSKILI